MRDGSKYTPLAELPCMSEMQENTPITWDFELPQTVDAERLVINNRQLGYILKVAAFRAVHVSSYQGQTSSFTPGVRGVDAHGVATAAASGYIQQADTHQASMHDDYPVGEYGAVMMQDHGKTRAIARLNKAEIASKVVDEKRERNVSSDTAWARHLNTALNGSLRSTAKEHLTGRGRDRFSKYFTGAYHACLGGNIAFDVATGQPSTLAAIYVGLGSVSVAADEWMMRRNEGASMLSERRWSLLLLSSEQWDRYFAAQALTRTAPLIKALQ